MISIGSVPTTSLSLGAFILNPITEFNDLIPNKYLPYQQENANLVQGMLSSFNYPSPYICFIEFQVY